MTSECHKCGTNESRLIVIADQKTERYWCPPCLEMHIAELESELKIVVQDRNRLNYELIKVYQNYSADSKMIADRLQANEEILEKILAAVMRVRPGR